MYLGYISEYLGYISAKIADYNSGHNLWLTTDYEVLMKS